MARVAGRGLGWLLCLRAFQDGKGGRKEHCLYLPTYQKWAQHPGKGQPEWGGKDEWGSGMHTSFVCQATYISFPSICSRKAFWWAELEKLLIKTCCGQSYRYLVRWTNFLTWNKAESYIYVSYASPSPLPSMMFTLQRVYIAGSICTREMCSNKRAHLPTSWTKFQTFAEESALQLHHFCKARVDSWLVVLQKIYLPFQIKTRTSFWNQENKNYSHQFWFFISIFLVCASKCNLIFFKQNFFPLWLEKNTGKFLCFDMMYSCQNS